jgi:hypothetical protein
MPPAHILMAVAIEMQGRDIGIHYQSIASRVN